MRSAILRPHSCPEPPLANPPQMHPAAPQEFFRKNSYCARGPHFTALDRPRRTPPDARFRPPATTPAPPTGPNPAQPLAVAAPLAATTSAPRPRPARRKTAASPACTPAPPSCRDGHAGTGTPRSGRAPPPAPDAPPPADAAEPPRSPPANRCSAAPSARPAALLFGAAAR